jgi:hypothetical protein
MPDLEQITLEVDERPAVAAVARGNAAMEGYEKTVQTKLDSAGRLMQAHGEMIVRVNDRSRSSLDRLLQSLERQSALAGKSGVDRMVAERDLLIKKWGQEDAAVKAITESYRQRIAAEQQSANLPTSGAGVLQSLGPLGTSLATGMAALTAFTAGTFEMVKSLGAWATGIKEVELRTGLTAKEVAAFGFAAKAAGQDVSVFESGMRGLTMAVEDNSAAGAKARDWLGKFGVDVEGLRAGTASTAETFIKISAGLNAMPSTFERNAAGIAIFKRGWLEMAPSVLELIEHLKTAHEHGDFGITETEVQQVAKYTERVAVVESVWDRVWRKAKEAAAAVTFRGVFMGGAESVIQGQAAIPFVGPTAEDAAKSRARSDARLDEQVPGHVAALNEQLKAQQAAQKRQDEQLRTFEASMYRQELGPAAEIFAQRDQIGPRATDAALVGASAALAKENAAAQRESFEMALRTGKEASANWEAVYKTLDKTSAATVKNFLSAARAAKDAAEAQAADAAAKEKVAGIGFTGQTDAAKRNAEMAQRMVGFSGATGMDAIRADYQIRVSLAQQVAAIEANRITAQDTADKQMIDVAEARLKYENAIAEAQQDAAIKQLELQKQQMDAIKKDTESLWNTLLTHPAKFPKQLANTVHEAVIKPVAEGMSGVTARLLEPVIHGADGSGGIAGVFKSAFRGGQADPMKASTDMNTAVTVQNSAALATLTAIIAGAMGMGAPAIAMPAMGGLGLSLPAISAPAVSGSAASAGGGFGSMIGGAGGFGASPTLLGIGAGGNTAAGGGILPMLLRAGQPGGGGPWGRGLGGFSPANLKGSFWNEDINKGTGNTVAASSMGFKGDLAGVLTSQGAAAIEMGVGTPLAMAGITGSKRGTWGGIGESTAGGALLGSGIGTMILPGIGTAIGAGIGAVAGFGIGAGEKLSGIESPENEAKRLVKSLYGVNIDTAMAKQIVGIAQNKYAGHVSIAVRDPDVRKMLELYAQGTGQKMPLSASTPYAGSLAEQGGKLYQQQGYNAYGAAYTFASGLPVLGGPGGGTYPTPGSPNTQAGMGGGMSFALNINGQPITPEFVMDASMTAQNNSYNRVQQSANMQVPGLMVA